MFDVLQRRGSQGQTYVLDVEARSAAYSFQAEGCRWATQGVSQERNGVHLLGPATPLYIYVRPDAPAKSVGITLSSDSPGETAAADVVSPTGDVVGSLDTTKQPAMQLVLPVKAGSVTVEGGFWTVRFKRPPTGAVDDVFLYVSGLASPWFGFDPANLPAVEPAE